MPSRPKACGARALAIAQADHVLFLVDAAADPQLDAYAQERAHLPPAVPVTLVRNKMDLAVHTHDIHLPPGMPVLSISAATGLGLDALRQHLATAAGLPDAGGGAFSARTRHVEALRRGAVHLADAHRQLVAKQGELAALELREAQRALGEVVGDVSSDELLGAIFGSFCIGK